MAPKTYQTIDTYRHAADSLYAVIGMVLFGFAKHNCDTKNIIIRNFIARSGISLKGVFALWDICDYQNAWVVYRGITDRMFHLHSIGSKNEFQEFDDWSFFEQYKSQHRVKSDKEFKHEAVGWVYELSKEQKERIKILKINKPKWKRPKAEDIAKDMDMVFLYNYGYDFASTHVHPMSNDGQQDFDTITKLEPAPRLPSQITVIHNTLLVSSMILQDGLNHSSFRWHLLLFDYIDEIRLLLDNGDDSYQLSFMKLTNLFENEALCESIQA